MGSPIDICWKERGLAANELPVRRHDPDVRYVDKVVVVARALRSQLSWPNIAIMERGEDTFGSQTCRRRLVRRMSDPVVRPVDDRDNLIDLTLQMSTDLFTDLLRRCAQRVSE